MAIITSVPTQIGLICGEAYINIAHIKITKQNDSYRFSILCNVYTDQTSKEAGNKPVEIKAYMAENLDLNTVFSSAYTHLKSLNEFENAIDA
jgi:hypothetical protein